MYEMELKYTVPLWPVLM